MKRMPLIYFTDGEVVVMVAAAENERDMLLEEGEFSRDEFPGDEIRSALKKLKAAVRSVERAT